MKKFLGSIFLTGLLVFTALSVFANPPAPKVEINGVSVYSPISYIEKDGATMVDVNAFFNVMDVNYQYDSKNGTISYKDETIKVKQKDSSIVAPFNELANLVDATSTKTKNDGTKYVLVLPEGTIKLGDSIANMGEHWANPVEDILIYEDSPPVFKTIYGVYEGELVFLEQMIAQTYMEGTEAKSWLNLPGMKGVPSPPVVQTDIEFQPKGHEHYEIPHYDFHHYFISDEEQQKIEGMELHSH